MPKRTSTTVRCANEIDGMRCERYIIPASPNVQTYRNGRKAFICRQCADDALRRSVKVHMGDDPDNKEYRE